MADSVIIIDTPDINDTVGVDFTLKAWNRQTQAYEVLTPAEIRAIVTDPDGNEVAPPFQLSDDNIIQLTDNTDTPVPGAYYFDFEPDKSGQWTVLVEADGTPNAVISFPVLVRRRYTLQAA